MKNYKSHRNPMGLNEYRMEQIRFGQGHYFFAKNLEQAKQIARKFANEKNEVVAVQLWNHRRNIGKPHLIKPGKFRSMSEREIIKHYKEDGLNVKNYGGE